LLYVFEDPVVAVYYGSRFSLMGWWRCRPWWYRPYPRSRLFLFYIFWIEHFIILFFSYVPSF